MPGLFSRFWPGIRTCLAGTGFVGFMLTRLLSRIDGEKECGMEQVWSVPTAVVVVAGLVAAITDVWKYKVYNVLTLPLLGSGLVYHALTGGQVGLQQSFYGVLFGLGVLLIPHLMGGMGSGDLKLLAGVGAWLKMPGVVFVFVVAGLLSALYSVVALLSRSEGRRTAWLDVQVMWHRFASIGRSIAAEDWVETELQKSQPQHRVIPFALMVAAGIVATVFLVSMSGQGIDK